MIDNEHEVTVLENLYYKQDSLIGLCHHKTLDFIEGDVNDERLIKTITSKYDVIIPLACLVGAPICTKNPKQARLVNFGGIKLLNKYNI